MARSDQPAQDMAAAVPESAPAAPQMRALGYLTKELDAAKVEEREAALRSRAGSSYYASWAPDPKSRITTGPGLPTWNWRSVALRWRGPVFAVSALTGEGCTELVNAIGEHLAHSETEAVAQ